MTFTAHIRDGRIVPDEPVSLPNGTALQLRVFAEVDQETANQIDFPATPPTLLDALADVVGRVDDLPANAASSVDDALYGGDRS